MSTGTEALLLLYATCRRCGTELNSLQAHLSCRGSSEEWWPGRIALAIPAAHTALFALEFRREVNRGRAFDRKQRLAAVGGTHTRAETRRLFKLQEGRCFYCFASLTTPEGTVSCHRDHFEAVVNGGNNSIVNIVLACPTCNTRKGASDGAAFVRTSLRRATPEARAGLRRIHRAHAAHEF